MPRIKNAAEKQYDPEKPANNAMGIIYGKFMSSQFLTAVLAGATLTPDGTNRPRASVPWRQRTGALWVVDDDRVASAAQALADRAPVWGRAPLVWCAFCEACREITTGGSVFDKWVRRPTDVRHQARAGTESLADEKSEYWQGAGRLG